jgi:hypothetical protein
MNILRKFTGFILNFKRLRSLLFTFLVRAARALFRPSSLKFGGVDIFNSKDRRIFSDLS